MSSLIARIIYGCFLTSLLIYSTIYSFQKAKDLDKEAASSVKIGSMIVFLLYAPFILYTTFN